MKKIIALGGGVFVSLVLTSATAAASFEESMARCISKHANTRDAATVMLECTADGGKLSDCKVLQDSAAGKGFDKAALCVAEALPMGSKLSLIHI